MCLVYGGGGVGVGWEYEILCVLSREGDVGAWVLLVLPTSLQISTNRKMMILNIIAC